MNRCNYNRRNFLKLFGFGAASLTVGGFSCVNDKNWFSANKSEKLPNIVIIFADDLGYGDLSCFGHPTIHTPNLDRMAAEGMKFTQFYSADSVCTPSRAALLTGRLPIRSGMFGGRRVLFPDSAGGLPQSEITIARALKKKGYATCCIGKWHLGHLAPYLPTYHGFDSYYGIPYSNDMEPSILMRDEKIIETPVNQSTLTKRYTQEAIKFIESSKSKPFFLYFPHTFPHIPVWCSKEFEGTSLRGLYGDAVEELDWSVGQVLDTLKRHKLEKNTLVIFTSDNGPWLTMELAGGSAGLLRGGKGSTWEGGMREPCIVWWPGKIKPASLNAELSCTMDIFSTCLDLAGIELPCDRVIDGQSLLPALLGKGKIGREIMPYYRGSCLMAFRKGPWKAHFYTQAGYGQENPEKHDPPLLYHLEHDPSEKYDISKNHPDVIADILKEVERHKATIKPVKSQLSAKLEEASTKTGK